jgi:hypothetical protein
MTDVANGFVTVLVSTALSVALGAVAFLAGGGGAAVLVAAVIFGLLYGLQTGILVSYDLGRGLGWVQLLVDLTWSLPNTILGFVAGNLIYVFVGSPSRAESRHQGWVVFMPRGSSGFGHSVLQTLGTVNLGGAGQHERMHLLQARMFGPLYLPLFLAFYVVTSLMQILWTATLGAILYAAKVRPTAYLTPPPQSAVPGFFGWIYYATPFELWAYASGNP